MVLSLVWSIGDATHPVVNVVYRAGWLAAGLAAGLGCCAALGAAEAAGLAGALGAGLAC